MTQYRLLAEMILPAGMLDWFELRDALIENVNGANVLHIS